MDKNIKNVLVTGGAEYIDTHTIIEILNSGFEFVAVDDPSNSSYKAIKRVV